jgi:hypothetical protein
MITSMIQSSKVILLVCLLFLYKENRAQIINIDKADTADYQQKPKFNFNFNTGLEIDKQKSTLYDASNTAEMMLQKNRELFLLASSYRFTYNGPEDILNAGYVHLRYRHNYKNHLQPESFIQYQWDNKRGLEKRLVGGMNLRYNFWKGDKVDFNAGLGLMYETERWNFEGVDSGKIPNNPVPITNHFIKINSYIRLDWKPNDHNEIAFNVFFQTKPDRFDPRIAPHVQWNIRAGKHIGFSISFSGIYDDAPVVPIDHFYYSLTNSIQLKF